MNESSHKITGDELGTILAALRLYQRPLHPGSPAWLVDIVVSAIRLLRGSIA